MSLCKMMDENRERAYQNEVVKCYIHIVVAAMGDIAVAVVYFV